MTLDLQLGLATDCAMGPCQLQFEQAMTNFLKVLHSHKTPTSGQDVCIIGYFLNVCFDEKVWKSLAVNSPNIGETRGSIVPWPWNIGMSRFTFRP